MSEQDFADVAAYFAAQTPAGLEADPSYWKAGEALYKSGDPARNIPACTACHGPSGQGNAGAGYPALRAQHSVYTVKQLQDYLTKNRYRDATDAAIVNQTRNSAMMTTIAARLTPGRHPQSRLVPAGLALTTTEAARDDAPRTHSPRRAARRQLALTACARAADVGDRRLAALAKWQAGTNYTAACAAPQPTTVAERQGRGQRSLLVRLRPLLRARPGARDLESRASRRTSNSCAFR